jgi:hypothetical protein
VRLLIQETSQLPGSEVLLFQDARYDMAIRERARLEAVQLYADRLFEQPAERLKHISP